MSKKWVSLGTLLVLMLIVGWWLISPLFLDETVNEELPPTIEGTETTSAVEMSDGRSEDTQARHYSGKFVNADEKHQASGDVTTFQTNNQQWVRLENFEVTNGPDLYTILVKEGQSTREGIILGKLKGNIGNQNYRIPESTFLEEGDRIVIWCKAFEVDFGFAELFLKE
ncbi:DM13 domain-containing protein [Pseudalkalibacillus hwajinpoensis]|uniref:DM13 domain-containing protein n=1 Tax=Guptibacillus hwajinpoensis TaxID=208199 RepID=UPI001CD7EE43|nr:DM13 domain-containing protein [Pseudalkalibacillus hwajinpoensis]MCA0991709.1 DM13 domain-containing protein [Pseudalkalibacillus hwajinpoensis]